MAMLNQFDLDCPRTVAAASKGTRSPRPSSRRPAAPHDTVVKSATRALEIIELFGVCRGALSVSDVAGALNIPQSSSSILLQAMNKAGFIDRNRQTRKYLPSIRSAFLGNRMHDALFEHTSLLRALDKLSLETGCSVRLAVRNGIYVQYAHISWPEREGNPMRLRPGALMPICHDPLGVVLLSAERDEAVQAIVRHANATADAGMAAVRPQDLLARLDACRQAGFSEAPDLDDPGERVLAVRLPTPLEVPAAVGLCVASERCDRERAGLLGKLEALARPVWLLGSRPETGPERIDELDFRPAAARHPGPGRDGA
jgi:DNA-binding IclR family transcriptional regulator